MSDQDQAECNTCKKHISSLLGGRIDGLRLLIQDGGIILRGRSRTYYAKQLALQAVMEATDLPVVANEIEVRCAGGRP
jgi:hypothetical protein